MKMLVIFIIDMGLYITNRNLQPNLPGDNELKQIFCLFE